MKVYKDYFKQILTGLMHNLIEHSDLLRCHTWDFGVFIQVGSIMKHNELDCRNLYTILIFITLKMKKISQFAWKKITYCQILTSVFSQHFSSYVGMSEQ